MLEATHVAGEASTTSSLLELELPDATLVVAMVAVVTSPCPPSCPSVVVVMVVVVSAVVVVVIAETVC